MGKEDGYTPQEAADLIVARDKQRVTGGEYNFDEGALQAIGRIDEGVLNVRKLGSKAMKTDDLTPGEVLDVFAKETFPQTVRMAHDKITAERQGAFEREMANAVDDVSKAEIQKHMQSSLTSQIETQALNLARTEKRDPLKPIKELADIENALIDRHISAELKLRKVASIADLSQEERQKLKTEAELAADQKLAQISQDQQTAKLAQKDIDGQKAKPLPKALGKLKQILSTLEVANIKKKFYKQ